jgi:hypothetical protein
MTLHLLSIATGSPNQPEGLDEFEAVVMASNAPAMLIIDRTRMRELFEYLRHLKREETGR